MPAFVHKFLGTARWQALAVALQQQGNESVLPPVDTAAVAVALLTSIAPVLMTLLDAARAPGAPPSILPTVAFGVCALLALVIRSRLGIRFVPTASWRRSLSLTHTAVALGCIPAVIILIFAPNLLAERHDVLLATTAGHGPVHPAIRILSRAGLLVAIAMWVAVTEEIIFRGLVVSVIRRWSVLPTQRARDTAAAVVSALIFGLAHWATWGPIAALALIGLGLGFVLAFIATGEQLVPVVLYHFVFDLLSMTVSVL